MNTLKTFKLGVLSILFLGLNSCDSDEVDSIVNGELEVKRIENLHAPADVRDRITGQITSEGTAKYFNFEIGGTVAVDANWDIAFKGTSIIVNSGINGNTQAAAAVVVATFADVIEAPVDSEFRVDTAILNAIASGSGNGWYNYNPITHAITPIAGRVIVVKTNDGKYAKVEMLSYYKDQTTTPGVNDGDYLTFNYVYQPNGTKNF